MATVTLDIDDEQLATLGGELFQNDIHHHIGVGRHYDDSDIWNIKYPDDDKWITFYVPGEDMDDDDAREDFGSRDMPWEFVEEKTFDSDGYYKVTAGKKDIIRGMKELIQAVADKKCHFCGINGPMDLLDGANCDEWVIWGLIDHILFGKIVYC